MIALEIRLYVMKSGALLIAHDEFAPAIGKAADIAPLGVNLLEHRDEATDRFAKACGALGDPKRRFGRPVVVEIDERAFEQINRRDAPGGIRVGLDKIRVRREIGLCDRTKRGR